MHQLIVLGMHRSGTSLVARACDAAGVAAGPCEEFLSAQEDNPDGFFEARDLVRINDSLLVAGGGSWSSPPASIDKSAAVDDIETFIGRLTQSTGPQYLLKDPRLCLTWPAWIPAASETSIVFVYRSPLAVARSLARRNSFPLQFGLLLWEYYNRRALVALEHASFDALNYDQLDDRPELLGNLIRALQKRGFTCSPSSADGLYSRDLRHHGGDDLDKDHALLTASQRYLHEYCEGVCLTGELAAFDHEACDSEQIILNRIRDLADSFEPLASVVETGRDRDDAVALVAERTRERDRSLASLASLERDHHSLRNAHDIERADKARAAQELERLNKEHLRLSNAHQREVAEHASLAAFSEELRIEFDSRGVELNEVHEIKAQLEHEVSELEDKSEYLFYSLTESHRTLLQFETSFLSRVQRYSRKVYRLLTFQRGKNSAYEDLLERAHSHFSEYELALPARRPNKFDMALDVLRYVVRNPSGSARSFSWARLKVATGFFFGKSSDDLQVWINARFPDAAEGQLEFKAADLPSSLDTLHLEFPAHEAPTVSVIVPVYNDYRVTMNCLASLHEHMGHASFEVIIADDCSSDLTTSITDRVSGISVARTPSNLRFLGNCNNAAASASGQHLLLLNNDTQVTEGWLEALLEPFKEDSVGIVGPKLLFADGRLQEAGGIIWRDASGWNFGRADDPKKPAYEYRRNVDYVSGACLLVRRSLWDELGGFDTRFAPAYYEDADLCFAAREAGYRVIYQPTSMVYHYEGVSNGTDLNSGVKQHQVTNQTVFRDKWSEVLDRDHFPNAEHVIHARDRSRDRYTVLIIDHYVPHWDKDAGSRSTFSYVKLLVGLGCRVQFMGANFFPHEPYTKKLQELGVEVLVGERIARHLDLWFEEHAPYIDEVFLHRPHVAEQFLGHLSRLTHRPQISFVGHDLHYLRFRREAEVKGDQSLMKEAERWKSRELKVMEQVDRIYYFSEAELDELSNYVDASKLRRIPLYAMEDAPIHAYEPSEAASILFVGGYNHPPNIDAACWLASEILPALQKTSPDAHLHLVGSHPPSAVTDLANEHVSVHGYVSDEDLSALYRRVSAAVVPLRYGAGVKGKVIEGVQHGVPVITTNVGAEGIPEADTVFHLAETTEEFAVQIARIFAEKPAEAERMKQYGAWLKRHFSSGVAAQMLVVDRPALKSALTEAQA
ncbi:MAG: glycosyltransferase [Pseudomonadota bacterium]